MAYSGQQSPFAKTAFQELLVAQNRGLFQIQFPYNLSPELMSASVESSGTVLSNPPFAVVATGTSATGSASFQSILRSHYRNGEEMTVVFSALFTQGIDGSAQYVGLGDANNGLFFGYNGATFSVLGRRTTYSGTVSNPTIHNKWVSQGSWNQDPCDGTGVSRLNLDPTKGNVYKIQMKWPGFGIINFFIENPLTGQFLLVHQLQYINNTNTVLSNPSLPLLISASNSTNTQNMSIQVPSMAFLLEELNYESELFYSQSFTSGTTTPTTLENFLNITVVSTFNGVPNGKLAFLTSISIQTTSSDNTSLSFLLVLNPVLTGTNYINVSEGNSCIQYDTSGSYSNGGRTLFYFLIDVNAQANLDLVNYNIALDAGDVLMVGIQNRSGSGSPLCSVNLCWIERY